MDSKLAKIALWAKESGNLMSASKGLTEQEIAMLQSLKVGDRFIVMHNTKKFSANGPDYSLQKYEKKDKSGDI